MFLISAVTLLVAPIVTAGMMVDVRRQKRLQRAGGVAGSARLTPTASR